MKKKNNTKISYCSKKRGLRRKGCEGKKKKKKYVVWGEGFFFLLKNKKIVKCFKLNVLKDQTL